MYSRILVGLDGSLDSNHAMNAVVEIASRMDDCSLLGCHVYAAEMHRDRFRDMEPGLPGDYQKEEKLQYLRDTHEDIIGGGMKIISDAYLDPLASEASTRGIRYEGRTPEGRNYVEFLKLIDEEDVDLVALGSQGHGRVPEQAMGSFTERVLLHGKGPDILIMKGPLDLKNRPVVVGVDGSQDSYMALLRGIEMARAFNSRVISAAVYDPFFHTGVFGSISKALSGEDAQRFNFVAQEKLHDEIIDGGLAQLYSERMQAGIDAMDSEGVEIEQVILAGKVFAQLHHLAHIKGAGLLVLGRYGLHRERCSSIGSNTMNLARIANTNLLVVSPPSSEIVARSTKESGIAWTKEALEMMERVPPRVRGMAKMAVENYARQMGAITITPELVTEVSGKVGMEVETTGTSSIGEGFPQAEVVVLRKFKRMAPRFHEHILKGKITGQVVSTGDRILVYEVMETVPSGKVVVGERTRLEFC